MKIQGKVTDSRTGEALPSVSVFSADENFKPLGHGVLTDTNGNYVFDSADLDSAINYVGFSSAGYQPAYQIPGNDTLNISLDESGTLDTVVITAKKMAKKVADHVSNNKTVYYVIGAVATLGIVFFIYKRIKKHG